LPDLPIDHERLAEVCRKWRITELSLFGSALREDFGPDSDVDLLVEFEDGWTPSLGEDLAIRDELSALFSGRAIDLVERRLLQNPFLLRRVLTTRRVVYAA